MMNDRLKIIENTPTIQTDRLILRRFTPEDVGDLRLILSDGEANTFLPWYPVQTLQEAEKHLRERYLKFYKNQTAYRYAICLKSDNRPVGYVAVSESESNDLGYGLRKDFWHKGIVTEASRAVVERLRNAGYLYITATHDIHNPRSGEVMKKIGMKYCYSYVEQWQPKNRTVTFRMYQLNFDGASDRVYMEYWNKYADHFIESGRI